MRSKSGISIASLISLTLLLVTLPMQIIAGGPLGSPGKPGAPVDLRWLDTGDQGRVSVEVVAGVDYDSMELRLLVPGLQGVTAPVTLADGIAGAVRQVDWHLADEPAFAPRVLVILETGGRRLGRVIPAPSRGSNSAGPAAAHAPMPTATEEGLIEMRGEVEHRQEARDQRSPD